MAFTVPLIAYRTNVCFIRLGGRGCLAHYNTPGYEPEYSSKKNHEQDVDHDIILIRILRDQVLQSGFNLRKGELEAGFQKP